MAAQNLLHRTFKVVVPQDMKNTTKKGECQLVRFKKRLLSRVRISPMKGRSASHRAHAEHVHLARLAIEQHPAFIPVHLRFAAELIGLRHKDLVPKQAHGRLARTDIPANRRS